MLLASRTYPVQTPDGWVVVRADPTGLAVRDQLFWTPAKTWNQMRRLWAKDRQWRIEVRRFHDDPLGPVLHTEDVPTKSLVPAAVESVSERLRSGALALPSPK